MDAKNPVFGVSDQNVMNMFDAIHTAVRNMAYTAGGAAVATTTTKAKSVNTITYSIAGVAKSKAGTDNLWTLPATTITADATLIKEAIFLFCLDASGTASCVAGDIATGSGNAKFPAVPAGTCAVGFVRVATTAGGSNFVGATTALNAAGYTFTFGDLIGPLYPRFDAAV